jgi:hypothetical protein
MNITQLENFKSELAILVAKYEIYQAVAIIDTGNGIVMEACRDVGVATSPTLELVKSVIVNTFLQAGSTVGEEQKGSQVVKVFIGKQP